MFGVVPNEICERVQRQFHVFIVTEGLIVVVSHVRPDTTNVPATEDDVRSYGGSFCRS